MSQRLIPLVISQALWELHKSEQKKKAKDLHQLMPPFVILQTKEAFIVLYPFHYAGHHELLWHLHDK